MYDAIKPLLDSGLLNEEAKSQIQEAWDSKVKQVRQEVTEELRAEFAGRYEHDKEQMVEALNKAVDEGLSHEIQQLVEEKRKITEDRARAMKKLTNKMSIFNEHMNKALAKELVEFKQDRTKQNETMKKLEKFVVEALAKELAEFVQDKKDLANTKVKLVKESKEKFEQLKKDFIARGSKSVSEVVDKVLTNEIGQLKEDIRIAHENNFGRKLYEAFASEFASTHLNENAQMRKMNKAIEKMKQSLEESQVQLAKSKALLEAKDKKIQAINESVTRERTLEKLVKPLSTEKAEVMRSLLESVSTDRLENAFEKYLPAVVDGSTVKPKKVLAESVNSKKEVTGNRAAKVQKNTQNESLDDDDLLGIKRLAGLAK